MTGIWATAKTSVLARPSVPVPVPVDGNQAVGR
jgi:hypothetical protein